MFQSELHELIKEEIKKQKDVFVHKKNYSNNLTLCGLPDDENKFEWSWSKITCPECLKFKANYKYKTIETKKEEQKPIDVKEIDMNKLRSFFKTDVDVLGEFLED